MAWKVQFKNTSDQVINGMLEEQKKALRESAKVLKKASKEAVPVVTGHLKAVIATWVRVNKKSGEVKLQLGVYNAQAAKKKGLFPAGSYAHLVEFGGKHNRAKSFLKAPTIAHIEEIRKIQSQYLPNIVALESFKDEDEEVQEVE